MLVPCVYLLQKIERSVMKNTLLCLLNVALLICGQLMFKFGTHNKNVSSLLDMLRLLYNPYIILAVSIYTCATLLWIYILIKVPLNYSYLIQALAFPLVTLLSIVMYNESVPITRWVGIAVIMLSIFLASI